MMRRGKRTSNAIQKEVEGYRVWPFSFQPHARVKNKTKMVGTVGTRLPNEPVSLMYQGIELFPPSHVFGGNKVGTVGTKRPCVEVVPTCSHYLLALVGTEKPSNGAG